CILLSLFATLLQCFVALYQPPSRTRQRRSYRARRKLQRFRDLVVIQSFFPHEQGEPVTFGQGVNRLSRHCRFLSPFERRLLRLDAFALLLCQECQMLSAPDILPRFVQHEIGRHGKQPRSLVLYRSLSQCTHKSLLRHFFRPVAISQTPRQISHQRGVVRSEESFDVGHSVTSGLSTSPDHDLSDFLHQPESARSPCCPRRRSRDLRWRRARADQAVVPTP